PGRSASRPAGPEGDVLNRKINQVLSFKGLERVQVESAEAGDIVLINGIEDVGIGATICAVDTPEALPMITVDEPTLTMNFLVNSSPLAGR
ncbi:translational GTPase TypA, partial [Burkholderia cenocepacia]|nr:translational GTPase TypA [Burkholderia cenocepacia]